MAKVKALIVDDEPLARERISDLLEAELDVEIVASCANGIEAVAAIERLDPDLVFLDVQMPEMDGFEVIEAVGVAEMPVTIFVTAYDQHALKAFEVHALDYLLKPFDRERFHTALQRARTQLRSHRDAAMNRRLLSMLKERDPERQTLNRLVVKSSGRVLFLKSEEIDWIEAAGNYVRLHVGGQSHLLRDTMTNLEGRLDETKFLRIHRSIIVNIDRIRELQPLFHGEYSVTLSDGTELTLSRGYRDRLQQLIDRTL